MGRPVGFKLSEETKQKMREARWGKKTPTKPVIVPSDIETDAEVEDEEEGATGGRDRVLFEVGSWTVACDGRQFILIKGAMKKFFTSSESLARFFHMQDLPSTRKIDSFSEQFEAHARALSKKFDKLLVGLIKP